MSWASFPKFLLAQSCNRWNLGSKWWMMECCSCKGPNASLDTFWWEVNDCKNHLIKARIEIAIAWCSLGIYQDHWSNSYSLFCFANLSSLVFMQRKDNWIISKVHFSATYSQWFCYLVNDFCKRICKLLMKKQDKSFRIICSKTSLWETQIWFLEEVHEWKKLFSNLYKERI